MEVKYCRKCFGLIPCWCISHEYVSTWDFVYHAIKRTKGK